MIQASLFVTTFRRELVKISGTSLQKKITVQVLDGILERYLLVQIFVSAVVGVATGLAFWALGMENAAVWGSLPPLPISYRLRVPWPWWAAPLY